MAGKLPCSNHVKPPVCPDYPNRHRFAASKQAITSRHSLGFGLEGTLHARDTRPDRRVYKLPPAPNLPSPNLLKNVPLFSLLKNVNQKMHVFFF